MMQSTVSRADLGAAVPSCPGWTVRNLVTHTGIVHRHKTAIVRDKLIDGPADRPGDPDGDVIEWFNEGVEEMLGVFGAADLDAPTWTWCEHDHVAEWWVRRMAHETAIHGADAALTVGETPIVDEALASDGIDELLVEMLVGAPSWAVVEERDDAIELITPQRSWFLRTATWSGESPRGNVYNDEPGFLYGSDTSEPDAVITCTAEALDLWLWGRGELPGGTVSGDRTLVGLLRSTAAEATQ